MPRPGRRVRAVSRRASTLWLGVSCVIVVARSASADPGLQITPSIGLNEAYTDNQFAAQKSSPDLVTQFSPSISINGETARTAINFVYQPVFNHFDLGESSDRIDQNLNAVGDVIPLTDELRVDFTATASEAGSNGNSTNQLGVIIPAANRILYYIGTVTPHLTERYRDKATLDLTYSINSTNTSAQAPPSALNLGVASSDSLAQKVDLAIGSAESFGRLGAKLDFSHSDTSGSGPTNTSTIDSDVLRLDYHISRAFTFNGSVGYQDTDYPARNGTAPYHNAGLTWNVGLGYTPNTLSSIQLGYGEQQGSYNPSLQMSYALGPRTNILASYLVTVQNQLSSVAQNTQFLTFDQFGNPIDSRTGLPFNAVDQTFSSQNVLFRDKPALLSISHQFLRSSMVLSAQYEVRTSLSGPAARSEVFGVTVSYAEEFTPLLQGNVSLGYINVTSTGSGSLTTHNESISVTAALFYQLSDSVTFNVVENYFTNTSNLAANGSTTQQLTVGVRKSF